jgi:hypothetical protein
MKSNSNHSSSDESDLNEQQDEPPYPNNIFMKYGGFERARKIAASLQTYISKSSTLSPFFATIDTKKHIKAQE